MSIYHCSIKIISRAGGRSAVASAAYRSGERLLNEETGTVHDFTNKAGVVMSEIMLPVNAPREYLDRQTLWNEVQKVEKRVDAQLAREVEVALPKEMTRDEHIECVRDYINENFVSKGMIADWALHDKNDGNPHAHIMLTVRNIDENHNWCAKQRTVFANARNSEGTPIYNPSLPTYDWHDKENTEKYRIPKLDSEGNQKTRVRKGKGTEYLWEKISISENDWNDRANANMWRKSWAKYCNKYLSNEKRIDHRSNKERGLEELPTIHEGYVARQIEKWGGVSSRCETNREIREINSLIEKLRKVKNDIKELVAMKAKNIIGKVAGDKIVKEEHEKDRETSTPNKLTIDKKTETKNKRKVEFLKRDYEPYTVDGCNDSDVVKMIDDINEENKIKAKERADKEANSWKASQTSNVREDKVRTGRRRRRR